MELLSPITVVDNLVVSLIATVFPHMRCSVDKVELFFDGGIDVAKILSKHMRSERQRMLWTVLFWGLAQMGTGSYRRIRNP